MDEFVTFGFVGHVFPNIPTPPRYSRQQWEAYKAQIFPQRMPLSTYEEYVKFYDEAFPMSDHDKELAVAVQNGEVSREELERIWRETEYLSAQTPITVRRAVIAMRKAPLSEKMIIAAQEIMRVSSNIEAALTRDESKFAHLVAGAETVAKSMQNIGDIDRRLESIERQMSALATHFDTLIELLAHEKKIDKTELDGSSGADEGAPSSEPTLDPEVEAELARKRTIGSAWAK
jgi:hypothetical protein